MRKNLSLILTLVSLILAFGVSASAQQNYVAIKVKTFNSVDTSTGVNLIGSPVVYQALNWQVNGSLSTCQVQVDSSADGVNWNSADVIGSQLCTSNGSAISVAFAANYIRIHTTAISGTGTLTAVWTGYTSNPSGVGNCTVSADHNTLTCPNVIITGNLTAGPGNTTDGTPLINQFVKLSGANYVIATTADTASTALNIMTCDPATCTNLATNHGYFAHAGDIITVKADAIGLTQGHQFGMSGVTGATAVDQGIIGTATAQPVCGTVITTAAANATASVYWQGCSWRSNEHVITFNLIKSGAIGVFPAVTFACTIYQVDVTADQAGTIALDIWKANAAIPTSGGKISGTTWTPLSSAQSSFNTSLSGWTSSGAIAVASGDVFGGTVGTFTTVTNVLVQIRCH